jgi:K(+)-stimulated pyrophosphate-energized sodium pump
MISLATEGGYQVFKLGSSEWFWLIFSAGTALLAIAIGFYLMRGVLAADQGTPTMIEIAKAIQEGAMAYLRRQFRTIAVILVPLAIVVFVTSTEVLKPVQQHLLFGSSGSSGLTFVQSGIFRTLAFLAGCALSGLTGFVGMSLAVRGNVRTAAAAKSGSLPAALRVAFRTGGVAGMFTVGLGLLGATIIIMLFQNTASAILIGFGFGGSLLALFLRVGGGIFTKAADVGADLVGKVEAGIPEDDPRNPATIADNVGDNVGDCAGMAADLFESYEVTLVASIILGVAAFRSIGYANPVLGLIFPVAARAIGVLASICGVFAVRATDKDKSAMAPINPVKSIGEIWRLVNEPGAGFVLMAIEDEVLVGTLGVLSTDWWYGDVNFLTDRFFFVVDHLKNKGIGKALEDEAAAVAKELNANLIINGKMRRKGASSFVTLPRTHAAA